MKTALIQSVNFGRDGNARDYQAYGWHGAEHGFTWSLGHESALIFPRFEAPNGYAVELYLIPRTAEGGPSSQRLCISVNGEEIGRATISLPATLGFLAPPPLNSRDKYIVLRLGHPDAFATKPGEPALAVAAASAKLFRFEQRHSNDSPSSSSGFIAPILGGTAASLLGQAEGITDTNALDLLSSFEMLAGNCEFGVFSDVLARNRSACCGLPVRPLRPPSEA